MLNVIMLSIIMLNVIMLIVVAPHTCDTQNFIDLMINLVVFEVNQETALVWLIEIVSFQVKINYFIEQTQFYLLTLCPHL